MKIALLIDFLTQRGGAEWTLQVIHSIFPESKIFTLVYLPDQAPEYFNAVPVTASAVSKLPFIKSHWRKYFPLYPHAIEKFDFSGFDLLISESFLFAKSAVVPKGVRHLCYILTPMRQIWDTKYIEYGIISKMFVNRMRKWDVRTSSRPDRYIAISKTVAKRIKEKYNRNSEVIYPPADDLFFTPQTAAGNFSNKYFLAVSRLVPYKRIDIAVEAFNRLGLPLKIIGCGREELKLKSMAGKNIEFLGELSRQELREHYRNCSALIFPQEEDFGIGAVEAQLCGKPVIAFRGGGALETVIENESGIFFNEQAADSLAEAVKSFNAGRFDPLKITHYAKKFGIERFKKEFKAGII